MRFILGSLSLLLASFHGASGQTIGVELCACSPSYYEFTLNFDLFCPPVNITENDAVDDTSCVITPFSSTNVTDLVPVVVESIDILELGQGLRVLVQENIAGTFVDGDTFNYTSLTATSGEIEDTADVPRGLQINIVASNKFNEPLINVFILTFTNNCGAYPVIQEGQSAGWTVFVSNYAHCFVHNDTDLSHVPASTQTALEPPLREYCPFGETNPPTGAPAQGGATGGPTTSPTEASTDATTPSPTASPSGSPTASPVDAAATTGPTGSTPVPTVPPVEEASEPPTNAPALIIPVPDTPSPTSAPVVTTDAPTTMAPVEVPTAVPVTSAPVTAAPTVLPTIATEAPIAMSMSMSMSMSMMYGDHDYIMEEFGLLAKKEKAKDSTAKVRSRSMIVSLRVDWAHMTCLNSALFGVALQR